MRRQLLCKDKPRPPWTVRVWCSLQLVLVWSIKTEIKRGRKQKKVLGGCRFSFKELRLWRWLLKLPSSVTLGKLLNFSDPNL